MKNSTVFIISIFILITSVSCEKEIDVNLTTSSKSLVVDGVIETGQQPYVTLTNSIGFFEKIDLNSVEYVSNAILTVEDLTNGKSIILKEYKVDTTVGSQKFFFNLYGPDVSDPVAMNFKGEVNHYYKLTILSNGKLHEAITKIPTTPGLDSLWTESVPGKEDSFASIQTLYKDPDTFGNAVRIETQALRYVKDGTVERYFTSFNSVYDDAIINGTTVPLSIDLGYDKSRSYTNQEFQNIGFMRKGDTVNIKWSAIDKPVFTFWQTLAFAAGSVGNPFSSPVKIQGNVSDALGVWAGYGSIYYTIIDSIK